MLKKIRKVIIMMEGQITTVYYQDKHHFVLCTFSPEEGSKTLEKTRKTRRKIWNENSTIIHTATFSLIQNSKTKAKTTNEEKVFKNFSEIYFCTTFCELYCFPPLPQTLMKGSSKSFCINQSFNVKKNAIKGYMTMAIF